MIFFIPARKGSRRILSKNTAILSGKPLIQWTFDVLKQAISILKISPSKVLVSSDDDSICSIANEYGFDFFSRPAELCSEKVTMLETLTFHIQSFINNDVCVLYPTSPLRTAKNITDSIYLWHAQKRPDRTLMSVEEVNYRPFGLMDKTDDGFLKCNHPYGEMFYQTQGMPSLYRANGAIYIIPWEMISDKKINTQLFCKKTIPYVMDKRSSHEIDDPDDLMIAEAYLQSQRDSTYPSDITKPFVMNAGTRPWHGGTVVKYS